MTKKVSIKNLIFTPASHEDPKDPGVWKKVLFEKDSFNKDTKIQMVNWARLPKGKSFRAHYHQDMEEIFIILSGKARIKIEKKEFIVEKGDAIIIPIKAIHKMENISEEDVDYIAIGLSQERGGRTVVVEKKPLLAV